MIAIRTTPERAERIHRAAFGAAAVATVLAPVHALARYATEDGKADLDLPGVRTWAEPAREALGPLLDWGSPDTVYVTYGKLFFPVVLLATLSALAVRGRRGETHGAETWGWRLASVGYVVLVLASLGEYWSPWLDESFAVLAIPGLLLSLIGSTTLGVALLRRGFRPRSSAWLLVLFLPLLLVLSNLVALGAGLLPVLWAWGLVGSATPAAVETGQSPVTAGAGA